MHTSGLFAEFTAIRNQEEPNGNANSRFAPDLRIEDRNQVVLTNTFVGFEFTMSLTRSGSQSTLVKAASFRVARNGVRPVAGGAARINFLLRPGDCVDLSFAPENDLFLLSGEVLNASLFLTREPPPPGEQPIENPANGHYYELIEAPSDQGTTWEAARGDAASRSFNGRSGHLVTITDAEEDAFLIENFPEIGREEIWLGGSDEGQEGDWYWITGEAWGYENWAPGEPTNSTMDGDDSLEENCLEYLVGWNDLPCNDSREEGYRAQYWIVEYSQQD